MSGNFISGNPAWDYYYWDPYSYDLWIAWFYDHPLSYENDKIAEASFSLMSHDMVQDGWVAFAIVWSTDAWSIWATRISLPRS